MQALSMLARCTWQAAKESLAVAAGQPYDTCGIWTHAVCTSGTWVHPLRPLGQSVNCWHDTKFGQGFGRYFFLQTRETRARCWISPPSPPKRLDVRRRERNGSSRKDGSQKNSRKKKGTQRRDRWPRSCIAASRCHVAPTPSAGGKRFFRACCGRPAPMLRAAKKYCMLEPEPWASSLQERRLTHSATRAPGVLWLVERLSWWPGPGLQGALSASWTWGCWIHMTPVGFAKFALVGLESAPLAGMPEIWVQTSGLRFSLKSMEAEQGAGSACCRPNKVEAKAEGWRPKKRKKQKQQKRWIIKQSEKETSTQRRDHWTGP